MKMKKSELKRMIKEELKHFKRLNEVVSIKHIYSDKKLSLTIYVNGNLDKIKSKFKTAEESTAAGANVIITNYNTNALDALNRLEKDLKKVGATLAGINGLFV